MADQNRDAAPSHDINRVKERTQLPFRTPHEESPPSFDNNIALEKAVGNSAIDIPVQRHAKLLRDPRLSQPPNELLRARFLSQIQRGYGNTYVHRLIHSKAVQAKMSVNPPDDIYEKEADQVAEMVGRKPASEIQRQGNIEEEELQAKRASAELISRLQRQENEKEEEVQKKADGAKLISRLQQQEDEKEEEVQAKHESADTPEVSAELEGRINAARGSGEALPDTIRASFEPQFGRDFSNVRLHTDAEAHDLSHQLGARAFTTGQDIFFRSGDYQPESDEGRKLLGHEMTHLVQQRAIDSIGKPTNRKLRPKILGRGRDIPVGEQVVQCRITTPLEGYVEKVEEGKPATFKIGELNVVVKQDLQKAAGLPAGKAKTDINIKSDIKYKHEKGKITQSSAKITAEVQTLYGPKTSSEVTSGYGKGTTPEDIQAGTTTLGYHEGGHGTDYFQYMQANPPPEFEGKVGMTVKEYKKAQQKFEQDIKGYTENMEAYTIQQTDCVGAKATFCPADEGTREEEEKPAQLKIQRQEEEKKEEELQTKPASAKLISRLQGREEEKEEILAKQEGADVPEVSAELEGRINDTRGSGEALPEHIRASFEPQFGSDFSNVRVHRDAEADDLSHRLGARAFTTGQDIFFRSGDYQPDSDEGKKLLGHEMTHVVQQEIAPIKGRKQSTQTTNSPLVCTVQWPAERPFVQRLAAHEHAEAGEVAGLIGEGVKQHFAEATTHQVTKNEMPAAIAAKYSVAVDFLLARNAPLIRVWETPSGKKIRGFNKGTTVVIPGDSITDLAVKYSVSEDAIVESNSETVKTWRVPRTSKIIRGFDRGIKVTIPTGKLAVGGKKGRGKGKKEAEQAQRVKINGVEFTYGEVMALGDFFEKPSDMLAADDQQLTDLRTLIRKEAKSGSVKTEEWQKATGGKYIKLAEKNVSHFGPSRPSVLPTSAESSGKNFKTAYKEYHQLALETAQRGDKVRALTLNAFADHFLTDAFASGHMFSKEDVMNKLKQVLSDNSVMERFFTDVAKVAWEDNSVSGLLSQYETVTYTGVLCRLNIDSAKMFSRLLQKIYKDKEGQSTLLNSAAAMVHDDLNKTGIEVQNAKGDKWHLMGDVYINRETLEMAKQAVAQSQVNVLNAVGKAGGLDTMALIKSVWDYVPSPTKGGEDILRKTIMQFTDPSNKATIAAAAKIIKEEIAMIVNQLVERKRLKKA